MTRASHYFKLVIYQYHLQQGLSEERAKIWVLVLIIINYLSLRNLLKL